MADAKPFSGELARFFHETYETLAPEFSYKTRKESAVPWKDVPENNKKLMAAVAHEVYIKFIAADRKRIWQLEKLTTIDADKRAADRRNINTIADQTAVIERLRGALEQIRDFKSSVTEYGKSFDFLQKIARQALAERSK